MGSRIGDRNPMLSDHAVRSDQGRRADRPFDGFPLGIFPRPPGAIGFHDLDLRVGQERERQVELGDELMMRIDAVPADSENNRIGLRYRLNSVAEPARFFGSTGSIVLGIKPKYHVFPGVVGQRMLLAVAARQRKSRSHLPLKTRHCAPP